MPAESAVPPVTFGVKVTRETPGHMTFVLFAGRGSRGMAGQLTMRHDEFDAFVRLLGVTDIDDPARQETEGICCNRPNYVWEHSRDGRDYFRCHSCRGVMTKPRRVQDHEDGNLGAYPQPQVDLEGWEPGRWRHRSTGRSC